MRYEFDSAIAPAVIGMANIKTVFNEVVMSWVLFSARSFGYNAKDRREEYMIMFAMVKAAWYWPLAAWPP